MLLAEYNVAVGETDPLCKNAKKVLMLICS